jgi:hypothetical protein
VGSFNVPWSSDPVGIRPFTGQPPAHSQPLSTSSTRRIPKIKENLVLLQYIIVDFATAASQNGFSTFQLSLHNLHNIMQKLKKNIFYFHLYFRGAVKQVNFMAHLLSYANIIL